jgi:hypothetical protein
MNSSALTRFAAIAALAVAPLASQAGDAVSPTSDQAVMNACVATFAAENFAGRATKVNTKMREMRVPLALNTRPTIKLSATGVESGRNLATATCTTKDGSVTIAPAADAALVAAR